MKRVETLQRIPKAYAAIDVEISIEFSKVVHHFIDSIVESNRDGYVISDEVIANEMPESVLGLDYPHIGRGTGADSNFEVYISLRKDASEAVDVPRNGSNFGKLHGVIDDTKAHSDLVR